ncbi:MAG: phosphotransferase [Actinobacteria bacterium]|nr:phosphotransferase [Actinomycetota bacterium]
MSGAVFLVTGASAAGKSTVGRLLAERFPLSAFVEGDVMWKMVVNGREDVTPDPTAEAVRQLHLRYRHGAMVADSYAAAGFVAVHTDVVLEDDLAGYPARIEMRPLYVVVLRPAAAAIAARERGRGTSAYRDFGSVTDGVAAFDAALERSPRIGLWVDSSDHAPADTVDHILAHLPDALISD